jgi:hypothetical protein
MDGTHSMTSSAVASSDGDTVRPSICAVLAFITSLNLVDCRTGRAPTRENPAGIDAGLPKGIVDVWSVADQAADIDIRSRRKR